MKPPIHDGTEIRASWVAVSTSGLFAIGARVVSSAANRIHRRLPLFLRRMVDRFRLHPIFVVPQGGGLIEIRGVRGFLNHGDVDYLYDVARRAPLGAVLVEVGSFMGLSSSILARGLRASRNHTARLFCVDTFEASAEYGDSEALRTGSFLATWQANMRREDVGRYVEAVPMRSADAACRFADRSLDLVFIDGAHDYFSVHADLDAWWPKRKPDGLLCGHDYVLDDVRRAVDDFAAAHGLHVSVVPGTHGIWELARPGDGRA